MNLRTFRLTAVRARFALLLVSLALFGIAPSAGSASDDPPAPTHLAAIVVSVHEVILTWDAADPADAVQRYSIRRNGEWLATTRTQPQVFADVSVQASTTYTYTIRAIGDDDDASAASNAATIVTPALPDTPDVTPPSPPGSLTATALPGGVLLDWYDASDDTDITVYLIRRDGQPLALVSSGTLNYTDPLPQASTTAIYTVEAIDVLGHHSAPSNLATPAPPPSLEQP